MKFTSLLRTVIVSGLTVIVPVAALPGCDPYGPTGVDKNNCKSGGPRDDSRNLAKCRPGSASATCTAGSTETCSGNIHEQTCQEGLCKGVEYALCIDDAYCANGLTCQGLTPQFYGKCKPGISMPPPNPSCTDRNDCQLGDNCGELADCVSGLLCQTTCRAQVTGACQDNMQCAQGLSCAADKTCRAANQAMCTADAQCLTGHCQNAKCVAILNEDCGVSADCAQGLMCPSDTKKCTTSPLLQNGEKADDAAKCASGKLIGTAPNTYCMGPNSGLVYFGTINDPSATKFNLFSGDSVPVTAGKYTYLSDTQLGGCGWITTQTFGVLPKTAVSGKWWSSTSPGEKTDWVNTDVCSGKTGSFGILIP